jgi:acetyl-CoA carboxylase biotin carboxyl carrier protein
MVNLEELKQILDIVREHELREFELEHEGFKIKIKKDVVVVDNGAHAAPAPGGPASVAVPDRVPAAASGPVGVELPVPAPGEIELAIVKSPIVGTFYRAPEPGAPSFVEVGATVRKGQVLCIIEAMKLMNEIESEYEGEIVKAYVENGQPVQYGERLFAIRRA